MIMPRMKRIPRVLASGLLLCLCGQLLPAAGESTSVNTIADPQAEKGHKKETFLRTLLKDEAAIWTSPCHMRAKDLLLWGSLVAVTGILIHNDEGLYRGIKRYQNNHAWVDWLSPKITLLGDGGVATGISGIFLLSGLALRNEKARDTGIMALQVLIHTGIVVQVFKHLSGRQRPDWDSGRDHWAGPAGFFKRYEESFSKYDSFPSGHTITAWGLATVIAEQYRSTVWVPVLCYTLATGCGLSRITENTHWASDVLVGAALGFAISKMVVRHHRQRLQLLPTAGPRGVGFSLSYVL